MQDEYVIMGFVISILSIFMIKQLKPCAKKKKSFKQINLIYDFLDEIKKKKSLKIQENKIKIQKELYLDELKEIDEFYENLSLSLDKD